MNVLPRLAALLVLAFPAGAQTITGITPSASSPGYLVAVEGTGLAATTHVRFTGQVGGFVGVWTVDVPFTSISPTRVTAVVPSIPGWIPPGTPQGGNPFTSGFGVSVVDLFGGVSNSASFYFFEGTGGFLSNIGTGVSQTSGAGRPAISFALTGGPPAPGNPLFTPLLVNATPGALPVFALGLPGVPPYLPILDGTLVINPFLPYASFLGPLVDPSGTSFLNVPIPPLAGLSVAMQWGFLEPGTGRLVLSNGLQANY